jgi:hypothetical protein
MNATESMNNADNRYVIGLKKKKKKKPLLAQDRYNYLILQVVPLSNGRRSDKMEMKEREGHEEMENDFDDQKRAQFDELRHPGTPKKLRKQQSVYSVLRTL